MSADDLELVLESGDFSSAADWSALPYDLENALISGGVCISATQDLCTVRYSAARRRHARMLILARARTLMPR